MKSLFYTIVLLVSSNFFGQETPKSIQIKSKSNNITCDKDISERQFIIKNLSTQKSKTYTGKGCEYTVNDYFETGKYELTITSLGLQDEKITFEITTATTPVILPQVTLKEKLNTLNEVAVYGNTKQFIKVASDKTTVDVKDNPMLSTGSAYDAIKKLPGVITSPTGGGVTLNGKGVTIYIDGAPSTLTGSDLENYLSSLPANAIEKAELIHSPGASYDANANGSIINIVTNSKKMKGVNATANINYNFNQYQKPSPQILLNGKQNNLSWQTMTGYNYKDHEELQKNDQTFTAFKPNKNLTQERLNLETDRNFYFRGGINYKLNNKSNILFNYNANFANDRNVFNTKTSGSNINDYLNSGVNKTKNSNHEISLQYKTKLDTLGKTLNIVAFTNLFDQNPVIQSNAVTNGVTSYNNASNDFGLLNYYLKYDFEIPFKKLDFTINTGAKYNVIEVNNTGKYNLNNPVAQIIDFDYKESNLAVYAEARKKIKKLNLTAGIRLEDFKVNRLGLINNESKIIHFKNTNLYPNFSALYELTSNVNITATYDRKVSQPGYRSLDPNGSNFDQYNSSKGNLLLNPSYFDNYEFKISAMDFVQLGTNYTVSKNHNLFIFSADENASEPVSVQTFQQFDKFKTFSAFLNFPLPLDYFLKGKEEFKKRMTNMDKMNYIYFSINYIKSITTGYTFSFDNKPVWNYAAQSQINLPWNIKSSFTYFILPSGNWEIYKITKPIQQFDMSFNKNLMNKKLKLGFHVFDVFNQNEVNALVSSSNLETKYYSKRDSRTFRISLTYNFGNLKLEKENTNIDTDKIKQGSGFVK